MQKSFIDGVSSLSEDVISVLPAAHLLDQGLTQLYNIGNGANSGDLHHYPVSLWLMYLFFKVFNVRILYICFFNCIS